VRAIYLLVLTIILGCASAKPVPAAQAQMCKEPAPRPYSQTHDNPYELDFVEFEGCKAHWSLNQIPLQIMVKTPRLEASVKNVINDWNILIGRQVLQFAGTSTNAQLGNEWLGNVVVIGNDNIDPNHAAETVYNLNDSCEIQFAFIAMDPRLPSYYRHDVIMHEMGHLLGLNHDVDINSIMYPSIDGGPYGVTLHDIHALQRVYNP
jgi:predicted Zn-dependent protease